VSRVESVMEAVPRILAVCRNHRADDPAGGKGLTLRQASVLRHLHPVDPTMVSELSEHVGVTLSTMSLTLKRMEEAGYVRRERDANDRRVTNVILTPEGAALQTRDSMLDPHMVARVLDALDDDRRSRAVEGLLLLADAAGRVAARGGAHTAALTASRPDL